MNIGYYILKTAVWIFAVMPLWLLHALSTLLYPIAWHVIRYRREVVRANLRYSFPGMSDSEREKIAKGFYRHLCNMVVETIYLYRDSERDVRRMTRTASPEILENLKASDQSFISILGHFGNWELSGHYLELELPHVGRPVYKPLSNKAVDRIMYDIRARFGSEPIKLGVVFRDILRNKDRLTNTLFVSDQKPTGDNILWIDFLNQDTPVFTGSFSIAKRLNYPVYFVCTTLRKRGVYDIHLHLIEENPKDSTEEEMAKAYFRLLEDYIKKYPHLWLWSHRRWRRRKPGDKDIYNADVQVKRPSEI